MMNTGPFPIAGGFRPQGMALNSQRETAQPRMKAAFNRPEFPGNGTPQGKPFGNAKGPDQDMGRFGQKLGSPMPGLATAKGGGMPMNPQAMGQQIANPMMGIGPRFQHPGRMNPAANPMNRLR